MKRGVNNARQVHKEEQERPSENKVKGGSAEKRKSKGEDKKIQRWKKKKMRKGAETRSR